MSGVMVEVDGALWCVTHKDIAFEHGNWAHFYPDDRGVCDLRPFYVERYPLGTIVALDHRPRNVGGQGFRMLRYRVEKVDTAGVWVYGPLVYDGGDWLPDPSRVVRSYLVQADQIQEVGE